MTETPYQLRLLDCLHVVEIYRRLALQALIDADDDLAGRAVNRGRDGRNHHRVEQTDDILSRNDHDGSPLVSSRAMRPRPASLAAPFRRRRACRRPGGTLRQSCEPAAGAGIPSPHVAGPPTARLSEPRRRHRGVPAAHHRREPVLLSCGYYTNIPPTSPAQRRWPSVAAAVLRNARRVRFTSSASREIAS